MSSASLDPCYKIDLTTAIRYLYDPNTQDSKSNVSDNVVMPKIRHHFDLQTLRASYLLYKE